MYWWDGDRRETLWMEITRRPDIGGDLEAPSSSRRGTATGSYALVPAVRTGDVIVHYDSSAEAVVGLSLAVADPEPALTYWVARGTSARRAGAVAQWLPGLKVPLGEYRPISPSIALDDLRAHEAEIMEVRSRLAQRYGGGSLYFPWVPYRGQSMRTFQSYLVKLPRDVVAALPRLRHEVSALEGAKAGALARAPKAASPEDAVSDVGAYRRGRRGQSYQLDQEVKVAVEARAMNAAAAHYRQSWEVEDVHGRESYDLRCTKDGVELHVEVKGTTTAGEEVLLTANEVAHARSHPHVALFVLADIVVTRHVGGGVTADGGRAVLFDPWDVSRGVLKPLAYKYTVPEASHVVQKPAHELVEGRHVDSFGR